MVTLAEKMVKIAQKEIGAKEPTGDDKYIKWYNKETGAGFPLDVPWCAIFVSWCARQAGLGREILEPFASCGAGRRWLISKGLYKTRRETGTGAQPGDLIFYDWTSDGAPNHVGIVEKNVNGTLTVIEGNKSDAVGRRTVSSTSVSVIGYGRLKFPIDYDVNEDGKVDAADAHEILQQSVKKKSKTKKADVNGDGKVDAADALDVLQKSVKLK